MPVRCTTLSYILSMISDIHCSQCIFVQSDVYYRYQLSVAGVISLPGALQPEGNLFLPTSYSGTTVAWSLVFSARYQLCSEFECKLPFVFLLAASLFYPPMLWIFPLVMLSTSGLPKKQVCVYLFTGNAHSSGDGRRNMLHIWWK